MVRVDLYCLLLSLIAFSQATKKPCSPQRLTNAQLLNPQPGLGFTESTSIARDWSILNVQQDSHSPSPRPGRCRAAEAALFLLSSFRGGTPRSTPGPVESGLRFWVSKKGVRSGRRKASTLMNNEFLVCFKILTLYRLLLPLVFPSHPRNALPTSRH